jgi:hypothetical protein
VTRLALAGIAALLMSGCARTTVSGDAGCVSYGEARLSMPRDVSLDGAGAWGGWIADLDDRMTGACRP